MMNWRVNRFHLLPDLFSDLMNENFSSSSCDSYDFQKVSDAHCTCIRLSITLPVHKYFLYKNK